MRMVRGACSRVPVPHRLRRRRPRVPRPLRVPLRASHHQQWPRPGGHRRRAALRMVRGTRCRQRGTGHTPRGEGAMKLNKEVLGEMRIEPGRPAKLDKRSTKRVVSDWLGPQDHDGKDKQRKKVAEEDLKEFVDELSSAQDLLWSNGTYALLIVLQAMDAAGKDGTIKHVMSASTPKAVGSKPLSSLRPKNSATTSCGDVRRRCPNSGASASSTALTT